MMPADFLHVSLLGKPQIVIGNNVTVDFMVNDIKKLVAGTARIVLISDSNVFDLYGADFVARFSDFTSPLVLTVQPGEISKCYETKQVNSSAFWLFLDINYLTAS